MNKLSQRDIHGTILNRSESSLKLGIKKMLKGFLYKALKFPFFFYVLEILHTLDTN